MMRVKEGLHIPAGHQSVLGRYCDNSWGLIGILAVGCEPGDGFGIATSHVFDGHCVLGVEVLAGQNLKRAVVQGHTDLAIAVDTHLNGQTRTFLIFFC